VFKCLDELVEHDDFYLDVYVAEVLKKREFWEGVIGHPVRWRSYSDRNVFSVKDLDGRVYLNQKIYDLSDGKINLIGAWEAQRGASIERRIDFFRRLLFEHRWIASRVKCPHAIAMCKGLRRPRNKSTGIAVGSPHKHIFDALTYTAASECFEELFTNVFNSVRKMGKGESSVVQLQL